MSQTDFLLHPAAAQDIVEIWEYIANDNPEAAGRVRAEILAAIRRLAPFPHQGHRRSDLTSRPLRWWRVRDYLIAYTPDQKPFCKDGKAPAKFDRRCPLHLGYSVNLRRPKERMP